ncbi:alpha/beta hydrolase [Verrucomicrobiaceae bacterium N1E253]|uniref:Alpha/beta hydrolase n=1 Tax=Oceaniferula marina TaxID=2748318 RepID=A0A851GEQ6_9BACT|nr:alpha/beta hydrolase [Oceaniferula marina]NWK56238.1 alpha/beta hydrolase [Oceaniferula marina]
MANWKKHLIGEWNWKRPFKSILFIYLALMLFAFGCSNRLIYQPPAPGYTEEGPNIHSIQSEKGKKIGLCYYPAAPGMPTLLWSHGNAEDIGYLHYRFLDFQAHGYGILAYDYPGYGISEGSPDEDGCYAACEKAWSYLTQKLKVPASETIIYGQSVGSGPACWLASRHDAAGLVLVTPFTSAFRTVTRIPVFPGDQYPNIKRIPEIKTPLLVIHGDKDQIVAQWHGKKLYEKHPGPKQFLDVPGAGHNNLYQVADLEIFQALATFRNELLNSPAERSETHIEKVQ